MPTSRTGSNRPSRGFTLLELMVVMAIMLIMSGVVAASIAPALEDARLRAGSYIVIAALRYARSYAVTHHTDAAVVFDTERRGVSVQARETDDDGEENWRTVGTQAGRFRTLPRGMDIAEVSDRDAEDDDTEETTVTFSLLGQTDNTDITLRDERGRQRTIQVDGVTGRCDFAEEEDVP